MPEADGVQLISTGAARSARAACTTPTAPRDYFTATLSVEHSQAAGSMHAGAFLTINRRIRIFHRSQDLEAGAAVLANVLVNWHSLTFRNYFNS